MTLNISRHYTKAQYFPPSEGSYHINPAAAQYFLKLYQQKKKTFYFYFNCQISKKRNPKFTSERKKVRVSDSENGGAELETPNPDSSFVITRSSQGRSVPPNLQWPHWQKPRFPFSSSCSITALIVNFCLVKL